LSWDDNNSDWEDYEDPDELDVVLEARFRNNDIANGETILTITDAEKDQATQQAVMRRREQLELLSLKASYTYWHQAIYSLKAKVTLLLQFPLTSIRCALHPRFLKTFPKNVMRVCKLPITYLHFTNN